MSMIIILLFCVSLILFLVSFFQKNPYEELREEMDQLTFQQVQEFYQMKQRLKILEEELLINGEQFPNVPKNTRNIHEIIKNQVFALAQQGKPIEQIANQSSLTIEEVYGILKENNT